MRVTYNAPTILTFSLLATAVQVLGEAAGPEVLGRYFTAWPPFDPADPLAYVRLLTHVLGHVGWMHLLGNLAFILLLGPMIEARYGSWRLLAMIVCVAVVTGLISVLVLRTGLRGASGVAFLLIILASLGNLAKGEIPLSFVLVAAIFIGREAIAMARADDISQMAHIVGGSLGAVFGFTIRRRE